MLYIDEFKEAIDRGYIMGSTVAESVNNLV